MDRCPGCRGIQGVVDEIKPRRHAHHEKNCPEIVRQVLSGSLTIPPLRYTPEGPICLCISETISGEQSVRWFLADPTSHWGWERVSPLD